MAEKPTSNDASPRKALRRELVSLRWGRGIHATAIKPHGLLTRLMRESSRAAIVAKVEALIAHLPSILTNFPINYCQALLNAYNFQQSDTELDERREEYMISIGLDNRKTLIRWEDNAIEALLDALLRNTRVITKTAYTLGHWIERIEMREVEHPELIFESMPPSKEDLERLPPATETINRTYETSLPAIFHKLETDCSMLVLAAIFPNEIPMSGWGIIGDNFDQLVFGTYRSETQLLEMVDEDNDVSHMVIAQWNNPVPSTYGLCWHWSHDEEDDEADRTSDEADDAPHRGVV